MQAPNSARTVRQTVAVSHWVSIGETEPTKNIVYDGPDLTGISLDADDLPVLLTKAETKQITLDKSTNCTETVPEMKNDLSCTSEDIQIIDDSDNQSTNDFENQFDDNVLIDLQVGPDLNEEDKPCLHDNEQVTGN